MERLDFYLPNFPKQKITQRIQSFVELHDKYIRIVYEFFADEPKDYDDESLGWENSFTDLDSWVLKQFIYGIEVSRTINPPRYRLSILHAGNESMKIFFRKKEEALEMATKIREWWLESKVK